LADDQEQRNLEVVKLRIAFLQHITTLSGAAIVIILALIERPETTREMLLQQASTLAFFVLAALISVQGVMYLTTHAEPAFRLRGTTGRLTTALAGATFSAAIVSTAASAFGVPPHWFSLIPLPVVVVIILIWRIQWRELAASQTPTGGTEGEAEGDRADAPPQTQAGAQRPWWRRVFRG
jgi:hypothetical protein